MLLYDECRISAFTFLLQYCVFVSFCSLILIGRNTVFISFCTPNYSSFISPFIIADTVFFSRLIEMAIMQYFNGCSTHIPNYLEFFLSLSRLNAIISNDEFIFQLERIKIEILPTTHLSNRITALHLSVKYTPF